MTDRAQSETLGFVVVFTLVLGTMALVTAAGVSELSQVRDAERLDNAEQAMETLEGNLADLLEGRPSQATEVTLDGARLFLGDRVTWRINGTAVANASRNFSVDVTLRPVVYETEGDSDTRLVYANGAVFRQQRGGTVIVDGPDLVASPDGTAMVIVQTRQGSATAGKGGSTAALVRATRPVTELYRLDREPVDLEITIDSPRAPAWARALGRTAGTTCTTPSATRAVCTLRTDRVSVAVARVDIAIE